MTVHKSNILNIISPSTNLQHFITLPTKVRLVKAMFYPVVMYGCESWTIKKAEHQRIDAFKLWCLIRVLRVPWIVRRSNQSILCRSILNIHWKDWCWSSNTIATWCEELTHWKRPWGWERQKAGKGTTDNKMVGWHHWLNGHEFDQTPGDGEGQESLVYCSPRGHKESDMTERLDSNYKIRLHKIQNFFLFRDEDCRIFIKMTDSFESFILSDELSLENRKNLIFQGWGRENWSALHKIAHQGLS